MHKPSRVAYLDLLRGYLLFAIIIDHLQRFPGFFELFTGKGHQWASAAEGFFFLSGLMLGYVRGPQLASKGVMPTVVKIIRRAASLYVVSVVLAIGFTWWAFSVGNHALGLNPTPDVASLDWRLVRQAALLRYSYGWTDFLGRYVAFMLASIPVFLLCYRRMWYVAVVGVIGAYMVSGTSFSMSWQLLFLGGVIIGFHWPDISRTLKRLPITWRKIGAGVIVATSLVTYPVSYYLTAWPDDAVRIGIDRYVLRPLDLVTTPKVAIREGAARSSEAYELNLRSKLSDRPSLPLERLTAFLLWFSALMIIFAAFEKQIVSAAGWVLLRFGRASLLTFCVHGAVVFWANYAWPGSSESVVKNAATDMAVVLCVLAAVTTLQASAASGLRAYAALGNFLRK